MYQLNTRYPLMTGKRLFTDFKEMADFLEELIYQSNCFIEELTLDERVLMKIRGTLNTRDAMEYVTIIEFKDRLKRAFGLEKGFINQKEYYGLYIESEPEKRDALSRAKLAESGVEHQGNSGRAEENHTDLGS